MRIIYMFLIITFFTFSLEDYVIIKNKTVKVYETEFDGAPVVTSSSVGQKLILVEYNDNFAKILYRAKDGLDYVGYIKRKDVYVREVDEEKALEKIKELNEFVTKKISQNKELVITETYSYAQEINGEKNIPDSEGERAANATKFYKKASDKASWVYLGDRSLLAIEAYENNFVKVSVPNRKEFLYVKKNQFKYTRTTKFNSLIEKVIVVDRTNQNTQLFDYVGGEFLLTHSSKSTTGYNNNNNSYRTPRGFYIVSNVKPYMMYFDDAKKPDETKKLGRALYAVRFSGGYYLHGIPLKDELKGKERDATRKRVEAILGSHPSSHGCVRNSDEDAKFIYDWTNPIAIRKDYFVPTSPVAVIITD